MQEADLNPEVKQIQLDYDKRMKEILDLSWRIFKSQFINSRHEIKTEAPFQHHFAHIIRNIGELYCLQKHELFKVDLESLVDFKENVSFRSKKYIDITCEYHESFKTAIELKFKTKAQGAENNGRVDAFIDIKTLEETIDFTDFELGKFYMITNNVKYTEKPVGKTKEWDISHGNKIEPGKVLKYEKSKSKTIQLSLNNSYDVKWEEIDGWYFLEITIKKFISNKP